MEVKVVVVVTEDLPTSLSFHLLNVHLHEVLKCCKINALDGLFVMVFVVGGKLLQRGNMVYIELSFENVLLHLDQVLVIHDAVTIPVADSEDSQERPFVLGLQLLLNGVI